MEEAKPVVLTKPKRGREMLSKKGPVKEPEKVDKKNLETYYEGYVDGQLFLVPDSNLEAMKDMINFKMRPKTSIRYKHQTSYDIQYYDQFTEKLNELLSKIDDFRDSGDFEPIDSTEGESSEDISEDQEIEKPKQEEEIEEKTMTKEETESKLQEVVSGAISAESIKSKIDKTKSLERVKSKIDQTKSLMKIKSQIERIKSEIVEELEKEYVIEETPRSSEESKQSEELAEPEVEIPRPLRLTISEVSETDSASDELRIRFLISGHFKDGQNPLYIIQEYDGENNIFRDQKLDFTSSQENGKANISISGKLYTENILVESEGNPLFLNTKPEKIVINEESSKIFRNSFEYVFEKEDYLVLLQGKFIMGKNDKITPSLSFCIKEKSIS